MLASVTNDVGVRGAVRGIACAVLGWIAIGLPSVAVADEASAFRLRPPEDEIVYFLLPDRFENGDRKNDRGGLRGDRLKTGFDPTHKGFYHGGDLAGLTARLDYIESLGATAIWLGPIYQNKPVQGPKGDESAGYHGYWVTDFLSVDRHFGTNAELRKFVDAAHARGIKVYLDIITNHTADVISYRECPSSSCAYRSRADYPYSRRGGLAGPAINDSFLGDAGAHQTTDNFARLTDMSFAYTPFIPSGEEKVKNPAWLNDPRYYHNRGNTTFAGESSTMGDFMGLDDLMTEHPRVVEGFIEIFGWWIDEFGIDGFRIDTAKHVNPEFWQAFVPAMRKRAAARGIPNFYIFGEVATDEMDPVTLARQTHIARFPAVLDFAFAAAARDTIAGTRGTQWLTRLFEADPTYAGVDHTALALPTFVSNHDAGRFAYFVRKARPDATDAEQLARVKLAHSMLFLLRGVPVVYYGDEQGFIGLGNDQAARQSMFPSQVMSYNTDKLLGTTATTATSSFEREHPLRSHIAALANLRKAQGGLRRGAQVTRFDSAEPGLFVASRFDPQTRREILVAFNTATTAQSAQVEIAAQSLRFKALLGACPAAADAPGSVRITVPALEAIACAAEE